MACPKLNLEYLHLPPLPPPHTHTHWPSQVLVKKSFGDKRKRHRQRNWRLQQMDKEMDVAMETSQEAYDRDYTEFLEELEEDKTIRQNVNIYLGECSGLAG